MTKQYHALSMVEQIELQRESEELRSKLKEASDFIQKLGPTIDYPIIAEIEEVLK